MSKTNSQQKAIQDFSRFLGLLRRLGFFPHNLGLSVFDISRCIKNWKAKAFSDVAPPHAPQKIRDIHRESRTNDM